MRLECPLWVDSLICILQLLVWCYIQLSSRNSLIWTKTMVTVIKLDRYENIWAFNTITALLKLVWEYFVHLFDSGPYGITRHSRNKGKICFYFLSGGSYYRICHPGCIMPHCAGVINSDIAWSHFKFSRTWSGYIHLYDHLVMLWNMNIYDKSVSLCHGEMEVIHKTVMLHE